MAITRRQFIKRTGAAAAGTLLGPSLFNNPLLQKALADTIGDRYFVVVYLNGGNDGLNTVTPYDNGGGTLRTAYDTARTSLNLTPTDLQNTLVGTDPNTGAQLALHPGLIGLKNLYDIGKVAVVQGCGYPEYSLSHDQSRTIWQTADPLSVGANGGWVGRYLAANYGGSDIPGVNVSDAIVGEFKTTATSILTIGQLADFGFPYDYFDGGDDAAKRAGFLALCNAASGNAQPAIKYIGESGTATLLSSESYPALDALYVGDRPTWNAEYDAVGRSTARDLREIAKVIYGVSQGVSNVNARCFQVTNGGYDTHSDQGAAQTDGQHYSLHREIGDSIEVFYNDIANMVGGGKLCIIIWSEFSRRIQQNDSGTDHGSQAPMFVIGGSVNGGPAGGANGGVYGNHPNIDDAALNPDDGNTVYKQGANAFRSTDFRDVYGTLLKHWLGMVDPSVVLPVDTVPGGGDPDDYWTAPNFDLGFL
jgi:uncharacterized protein (DUF1501 family)